MTNTPFDLQDLGALGCETPGRPWLVGIDKGMLRAVVVLPGCGLWACPACAEVNARRWTARAVQGGNELTELGEQLYFLTLTHRGHLTQQGSLERWRKCWPKLSARMRRASPEHREYLYIHEQHRTGVLHTHFIMTAHLDKRWWKDAPAATGFGYMNDYEPCRDGPAAGSYAAKYLAKSLERLAWPKGWRRVGCSRGWPQLPEKENEYTPYEWLVLRTDWEARAELESLRLRGYAVHDDYHLTED